VDHAGLGSAREWQLGGADAQGVLLDCSGAVGHWRSGRAQTVPAHSFWVATQMLL